MPPARKHSAVPFWITVALVAVLVAYPLSFGPACWALSRSKKSYRWPTLNSFYRPIIWTWRNGPTAINAPIGWYANVGTARPVAVGQIREDGMLGVYLVPRFPK